MPSKRAASEDTEILLLSKKQLCSDLAVARTKNDDLCSQMRFVKGFITKMADELICPITFELPLNPVVAEDGRTYEHWAIKQVIETQGTELRSPVTNVPMGPQLLPSLPLRNAIENLVQSGVIDGDKVEGWKKRLAEEKEVKVLREKAEGGSAAAMYNLGIRYKDGSNGLSKDDVTAYEWFKRGADEHQKRGTTNTEITGQVMCFACMGVALLFGQGVEPNPAHAILLLCEAATLGSDVAAKHLGDCYYSGYGVPMDAKAAQRWYAKVATSKYSHLLAAKKVEAAQRLRELDA